MAGGSPTLWGATEMMGSFFGALRVPPTRMYMALILDTPPSPYISGNELDEPSADAGYNRLQIDNVATNWSQNMETITNASTMTFTTAVSDWGTINYWALCNTLIEGQVYFYGEFIEPVLILETDYAVIDVGTLSFTMGPSIVVG